MGGHDDDRDKSEASRTGEKGKVFRNWPSVTAAVGKRGRVDEWPEPAAAGFPQEREKLSSPESGEANGSNVFASVGGAVPVCLIGCCWCSFQSGSRLLSQISAQMDLIGTRRRGVEFGKKEFNVGGVGTVGLAGTWFLPGGQQLEHPVK